MDDEKTKQTLAGCVVGQQRQGLEGDTPNSIEAARRKTGKHNTSQYRDRGHDLELKD